MKESDWKIFKQIKEIALEKFCDICLVEFKGIIEDESKSMHDRYLLNYKKVQSRDKKLAQIFNGLSRSKAMIQLMGIRKEGIADDSLIQKLSDEFRDQTDPIKYNW